MSSSWLTWLLLSALTGSPVWAAVIVLAAAFVTDRFTWGLLPDPSRWMRRWLRAGRLTRALHHNPHDRRARLELADLKVTSKRFNEAVALLRPNLAAGDADPMTLFTMGVACLGAGFPEQGEVFLNGAEAADPKFRLGAIDLERGRYRLKRGDAAGARKSLEALLALRPGTIEGRVLLAQSMEALGDDGKGALLREEAWREYRHAPRFQRRVERLWAWRAKPQRPLLVAAAALLVLLVLARVVGPALSDMAQRGAPMESIDGEP